MQAYFLSGQHRRALQLLRRSPQLLDSDLRFKHLAALCLLECKQWDECLALLGESEADLQADAAAQSVLHGAVHLSPTPPGAAQPQVHTTRDGAATGCIATPLSTSSSGPAILVPARRSSAGARCRCRRR